MNKTLHYIFDPLCGWCYGASSALAALADGHRQLLHSSAAFSNPREFVEQIAAG